MSGWPITGQKATKLACTTTSGNIAMGGIGGILRIYNAGSVVCFVAVGASDVAAAVTSGSPAATTSMLVPPGTSEFTVPDSFTYVAGITESSTATLYFQRGVSAP
jgi:hypothetical protein